VSLRKRAGSGLLATFSQIQQQHGHFYQASRTLNPDRDFLSVLGGHDLAITMALAQD